LLRKLYEETRYLVSFLLNFNIFSETFTTLAHDIKVAFVKEVFIVVEFVKSNSVKMSERMQCIYLCFMYLNLVNYSFVSINVIGVHKLKYAVSNMICKIDDSLLKSLKISDNSLKYFLSFHIKIVLCMTMLVSRYFVQSLFFTVFKVCILLKVKHFFVKENKK
jgi:hypothetical protein